MKKNHSPTLFRPAFTIVEVLVVVAIIGLLVGILLPAIGSARTTARATAEMNGARQLMVAFTMYATTYDDAALPGYNKKLRAYDADHKPITNELIRARYPWRIAPFLDYTLEGLFLNEHQDLLEKTAQATPDDYNYLVSLLPSLGMNTMWVGGDDTQQGFNPLYTKTYGRFYITTLSQAKRPDLLTTFASARGGDPTGQRTGLKQHEGYFKIESPYTFHETPCRWYRADANGIAFYPARLPSESGFLSPRYHESLVVTTIDGHVEMATYPTMFDMRRWANGAVDDPDITVNKGKWALKPIEN